MYLNTIHSQRYHWNLNLEYFRIFLEYVVFLSCEIFNYDLLSIVSKARNAQVTFSENPTTANALRPNLRNLSRGGSTENCIHCFKI